MSVALVALALAACAAVAGWVLLPLWRGATTLEHVDPRVVALLARRESILASIRDVDADLVAGRLDAAAHATMRDDLVRVGANVLAALDAIEADATHRTRDYLRRLEDEVAALRGVARVVDSPNTGATPGSDARVDDDDTRVAGDDTQAVGGYAQAAGSDPCPGCGRRVALGDRFCARCGRPLSTMVDDAS